MTNSQTLLFMAFFLLFIIILVTQIRYFINKKRIRRWQKTYCITQHHAVLTKLYADVNGFKLSKAARTKTDAIEYVYGEIDILSFLALLSLSKPNADTVFCDLGSGAGKAVLAAAMVYPLKKSIGIEILPTLHACACDKAHALLQDPDYKSIASSIEFLLGDYMTVDFSQATAVFVNATALFGSTWAALCSRLDALPHLHTIISTSKPLLSDEFSICKITLVQMSWGVVQAFVHRRKTNILLPN